MPVRRATTNRTWEVLDPAHWMRADRRGRLAFSWYRINVTDPGEGRRVRRRRLDRVFEVVVDDYAEVWVDGQLPGRARARPAGRLVKGFNAPTAVVIARGARPGQRIQIAVFAANGPLSEPPPNFIWIRSATMQFYKPERMGRCSPSTAADVLRLDPAIDAIVPP